MINQRQLAMYPPPVCRVIARKIVEVDGHRRVYPISSQEVASKSGLSLKKVLWISEQPTWMDIRLGEIVAFLDGCGLLETPVWRMRWFLRRSVGKAGSFSHLELLPEADRRRVSTNYDKNLTRWLEEVKRFSNG
jgi:hypothetical protein